MGMQFTLARIPMCRSVLSVSPVNDLIHDRTMNALNGGCVAILEDNLTGKSIFKHGKNALLFRYDDESLEECLDIVCNQPDRAYGIARAGMRLREDPRLRFGNFTISSISPGGAHERERTFHDMAALQCDRGSAIRA